MDGGSLFQASIVNQICDEMTKRNVDNELWFDLTIYLDDNESVCAGARVLRWCNEQKCWAMKNGEKIYYFDDIDPYVDWICEALLLAYQEHFNRNHIITLDDCEDASISIYECNDKTPFYQDSFVIDIKARLKIAFQYLKIGFRSEHSYKRRKFTCKNHGDSI